MASTRELILYNRYGCHLCEDMMLLLSDYASELQFVVRTIDIDDHPRLQQQYNDAVPVLWFGDREVCRHFLDLNALREALNAGAGVHHHQAI